MAKRPTNTELSNQIKNLGQKIDKKFVQIDSEFVLFKAEMHKELMPFHDYIIEQNGITKGKASVLTPAETIGIPKEIINILKWCLLIIAGILGVKIV